MKAKINGMELEGTPEEIRQFMELTQEKKKQPPIMPNPFDPYKYFYEPVQPHWIITSGDKGTIARPKVKWITFGDPGYIYE